MLIDNASFHSLLFYLKGGLKTFLPQRWCNKTKIIADVQFWKLWGKVQHHFSVINMLVRIQFHSSMSFYMVYMLVKIQFHKAGTMLRRIIQFWNYCGSLASFQCDYFSVINMLVWIQFHSSMSFYMVYMLVKIQFHKAGAMLRRIIQFWNYCGSLASFQCD